MTVEDEVGKQFAVTERIESDAVEAVVLAIGFLDEIPEAERDGMDTSYVGVEGVSTPPGYRMLVSRVIPHTRYIAPVRRWSINPVGDVIALTEMVRDKDALPSKSGVQVYEPSEAQVAADKARLAKQEARSKQRRKR